MRSQLQRIVLVLVTGAGLFLSGINASDNDTLRIGMAKSFFAGMPEVLANIAFVLGTQVQIPWASRARKV